MSDTHRSNEEWDAIIEDWLNENDPTPVKKRSYLSKRQMDRRTRKEIPISSLPTGLSAVIQHQLYSSQFECDD